MPFRRLGDPFRRLGNPLGNAIGGGPTDTTAPTVVITSTESSPTAASPIPITITFSEEVTGFEVGDITNNSTCTLGNFATADNIVFTVDATPDGDAPVSIDIAAGVCQDLAGNDNIAATTFEIGIQVTVTYQPDNTTGIDTWTISTSPDTVQGSGNYISAYNNLGVGLIKFPISLSGGTPVSGKLYLTVSQQLVGSVTYTIRRILAANNGWLEGATWNYADGAVASQRWAGDTGADGGADAGCIVVGTDTSSTAMGSFAYASDAVGTTFEIVLDLTELVTMCTNNYGLAMYSNAGSSARFDSCEGSTAAERPKLVLEVQYLPNQGGDPEPATVILAAHGDSTANYVAFPDYLNSWMLINGYSSGVYINQAGSGKRPFNNLIRLPSSVLAINPDLVVYPVYQVMIDDIDPKAFEAMIRNIWTARPTARQLAVLIPHTDVGVTEVIALAAIQVEAVAVLNYYGIPIVDFRQFCIDHEANLSDYMTDSLHPTRPVGQLQINALIVDYLTENLSFLNDVADHSVLPDNYLARSDEYENTPQRINGNTGSETGTGWANVGTAGRQSSTAGDTIAFTATFTAFGVLTNGTEGTVELDIDGGGYADWSVTSNGYPSSLTREEHTITLRVKAGGSVRVDEFWAV